MDMIIEPRECRVRVVYGAQALDPIRIITENHGPGRGLITITCAGKAWTSWWGAMGLESVEEFFCSCNTDYLADNLTPESYGRKDQMANARNYLERIIAAVQIALKREIKPKTPGRVARIERTKHANELINVIASYGRRFFHNPALKRNAHFELCGAGHGRVVFVSEYRGERIETNLRGGEGRWKGFGHGGTLQALAIKMRDYIMTGEQISENYIVIKALDEEGFKNNIWGYAEDHAEACRQASLKLPIIKISL